MFMSFFNTVLYEPLYNGLIFLTTTIPGADIGIAVVILTLIVKFLLFPLAHKGIKTQAKMRTLEPEIKEVKEKHGDDRQKQAQEMMELYKKHGISPFSGCLPILIQLPIIIALYWVFFKGLQVDAAIVDSVAHMAGYIPREALNQESLYTFISLPEQIKVTFLGFIDMTDKSVLLALIAGISQFYQMKLAMPGDGKPTLQSTGSLKDDFAQNMRFQMRYVLPVFVAIIAYTISAAIALYWLTSNIFSICHELSVRRKAGELSKVDKEENKTNEQ